MEITDRGWTPGGPRDDQKSAIISPLSEFLEMMIEGKTSRQIADVEKTSIRAIEDRRRQLFLKMGFRTLPKLVTAI